MRKEINTAVVEDYDRYMKIRLAAKRLVDKQINLHRDERRANQQCCDTKVLFVEGDETASLNVSVNASRMKSFKFKLFCHDLMPEPCYRFDSDGPLHRNPERDGVTLLQRQVPTPHFHKYDENGREIAYKTELLVSDEIRLLMDYPSAMRHFCDEENVVVAPDTTVQMDELELGTRDFADPLEGVEFP